MTQIDSKRIDPALLTMIFTEIITFKNEIFDDRLRMQKTIYLLQSFGINLHYDFHWHYYGVFSRELAEDMHEVAKFIKNVVSDIPVLTWETSAKLRVDKFKVFIKDIKESRLDLEMITSIHYLYTMGLNWDVILSEVIQKNNKFKKSRYDEMKNKLIQCELVPKEGKT